MNEKKLKEAFMRAFDLSPDRDFEALGYRKIEAWTSVGHMRLISEIEEIFDVMLDTEEILDLSSFSKAKEILAHHEIDFQH